MKKVFIVFTFIFIVSLICIHFFYTPESTIRRIIKINANENVVQRSLFEKTLFKKWWPGTNKNFEYDERNFFQQPSLFPTIAINVNYDDTVIQSILTIYFNKDNSLIAEWATTLPAAASITDKIKLTLKKRKISEEIQSHLLSLKQFAENEENIYGMKVREVNVKNRDLISINQTLTTYPSTDTIYSLIERLRNHIQLEGAIEKEPPMLHIEKTEAGNYETMVALSIDKPISGFGKIEPKRMVLGKILVAEIKGGSYTVENQLTKLDMYVQDHKRNSPAIPYASLVTDRRKEKDTSKWVTKIYYPVY